MLDGADALMLSGETAIGRHPSLAVEMLRRIAVATEGDDEIRSLTEEVFWVPDVPEPLQPLLTVVPLQLLAYHAAVMRGKDVDKPRNLAKSVTVE